MEFFLLISFTLYSPPRPPSVIKPPHIFPFLLANHSAIDARDHNPCQSSNLVSCITRYVSTFQIVNSSGHESTRQISAASAVRQCRCHCNWHYRVLQLSNHPQKASTRRLKTSPLKSLSVQEAIYSLRATHPTSIQVFQRLCNHHGRTFPPRETSHSSTTSILHEDLHTSGRNTSSELQHSSSPPETTHLTRKGISALRVSTSIQQDIKISKTSHDFGCAPRRQGSSH